jgi:two-component system, NarL family, nitrate/nitrite response regulator NarL
MSDEVANDRNEFVTILICKNSLLCTGLKHLLANTCFIVSDIVVDVTSSGRYHFDAQPALFIVDASNFSEEVLGIIRLLKVRQPEARVAVVADHFDFGFVRLGISTGVDGFCLAASDRDVLIKSLELIMLGEKIIPGMLVRSMLNEMTTNTECDEGRPKAEPSPLDPGMHKLSNREAEILRCLMRGEPNKVIARRLDVAEATIKVHVKAILRKIGAANRTQAAMWATEHLAMRGGKP